MVFTKSSQTFQFNLLADTLREDVAHAVNIPLLDLRGEVQSETFRSTLNTNSFKFITKIRSGKNFSNSFLADTVIKWENACDVFKSSNINVVKIRIGLVLSLKGGFLKPIVMSTKFFAGTWFGKGLNIYSWIHIVDVVGAILFLVDKNSKGIYNLVAPNPVNSKNFMLEISKKLNRRIILPSVPIKLIKVLTGKMSELMIFSQNVSCEKIIKQGFEYEFKDINSALENLLK